MIYVKEEFAVLVLGADFLILIISLLFRKSKRKREKSPEDTKLNGLLGYYLIIASLATLILVHLAYFPNLLNYLIGLFLNALLFLMGMKVVKHE